MKTLTGRGPVRANGQGPLIDQEIPGNLAEPEALGTYDTTSSTYRRYPSRTFRGRDVVTDTIAAILFTAIIVGLILLSCLLAWVAS